MEMKSNNKDTKNLRNIQFFFRKTVIFLGFLIFIIRKILIATPVTLIALLKTVALYWKQEELAENAQKIWEESSQLHDRLKTFTDHFGKVGGNLNKALNAYNSAVGSYQGRVLPKARSIESMTMKTGAKDTLPDLSVIDGAVRGLDSGSSVLDHVPADDEE